MDKRTKQYSNRSLASSYWWEERKKQIIRLYEVERLSQFSVAKVIGVSQAIIGKKLKEWGVPIRPRWNIGARNGRYKTGLESRLYRGMVEKKICINCAATTDLCIHHKNGDHFDNHVDNLEVLCMSCHSRAHKTEWWQTYGNKDEWLKRKKHPITGRFHKEMPAPDADTAYPPQQWDLLE